MAGALTVSFMGTVVFQKLKWCPGSEGKSQLRVFLPTSTCLPCIWILLGFFRTWQVWSCLTWKKETSEGRKPSWWHCVNERNLCFVWFSHKRGPERHCQWQSMNWWWALDLDCGKGKGWGLTLLSHGVYVEGLACIERVKVPKRQGCRDYKGH